MPAQGKHTPRFHENAPRRLIREFGKAGSYAKLARARGVNRKYLHDLLHNGIEPTNPEIRLKLYLPVRNFNELPLGDKRFKHIRWWGRLTKTQRNAWILFCYTYKAKEKTDAGQPT